MIASEIISLVDILRKLASSKAELDKKYFELFVLPIWKKFGEIHQNYIETFQNYIVLADEKDGDIETVK